MNQKCPAAHFSNQKCPAAHYPGDRIVITYTVPSLGTKMSGCATITHCHNGYLYTCGHCFPAHAKTIYGDLLYSSGFDTPSEANEIAIIKLKSQYRSSFKPFSLNVKAVKHMLPAALMIHRRKMVHGRGEQPLGIVSCHVVDSD